MSALARFVGAVDALNEAIGRVVSWLTLGMVLVCFAVVVLRYGFGTGLIWMQELYVWFHAFVFMLGAGYTLKHAGHVRVDAVYGRLSPRRRAQIDILGTLVFLLPWCAVVGWYGWGFLAASYRVDESSSQPGGLEHVWVVKAAVLAFAVLVGLQGLAMIARRVLGLRGDSRFPLEDSPEPGQEPSGG